jgi:hypothetical protein
MADNHYPDKSDSSERMNLIRKLSRSKNLTKDELFILNNLNIQESQFILSKRGKPYNVKSITNSREPLLKGQCYYNAVRMMKYDYDYAEGYIVMMGTNIKISHAWNVDPQGNHIDFTIPDSELFDYFGVIVPGDILIDIICDNNNTPSSVLPFCQDL